MVPRLARWLREAVLPQPCARKGDATLGDEDYILLRASIKMLSVENAIVFQFPGAWIAQVVLRSDWRDGSRASLLATEMGCCFISVACGKLEVRRALAGSTSQSLERAIYNVTSSGPTILGHHAPRVVCPILHWCFHLDSGLAWPISS